MKVKMTIGKPIMSGELNKPSFTGRIERSVRVSGNYNDLENKPSIEGIVLQGNKTLSELGITDYVETAISGKQDTLTFDSEPQEGSLNPVTSNGIHATFIYALNTVNGWISDVRNDIPIKVSDLQNDSGFVNASQAASAAPVQSVNGQTGSVNLTIPTVPTNVSAFTNDAGYLTLATLPVYNGGVS
jgi:hypothetical protein